MSTGTDGTRTDARERESARASTNTDPTPNTAAVSSPLSIAALLVLTALATIAAGPLGVLAGLVTAVTWYGLGVPYALAAGHVVLAAAFGGGVAPLEFLLVELGFLAVLLAALVDDAGPRGTVAVGTLSAVGLVAVGWAVGQAAPLWLAAGTVCGAFALVAYGLHRYELVRLGLVPDAEAETDTKDDGQPEPGDPNSGPDARPTDP